MTAPKSSSSLTLPPSLWPEWAPDWCQSNQKFRLDLLQFLARWPDWRPPIWAPPLNEVDQWSEITLTPYPGKYARGSCRTLRVTRWMWDLLKEVAGAKLSVTVCRDNKTTPRAHKRFYARVQSCLLRRELLSHNYSGSAVLTLLSTLMVIGGLPCWQARGARTVELWDDFTIFALAATRWPRQPNGQKAKTAQAAAAILEPLLKVLAARPDKKAVGGYD